MDPPSYGMDGRQFLEIVVDMALQASFWVNHRAGAVAILVLIGIPLAILCTHLLVRRGDGLSRRNRHPQNGQGGLQYEQRMRLLGSSSAPWSDQGNGCKQQLLQLLQIILILPTIPWAGRPMQQSRKGKLLPEPQS